MEFAEGDVDSETSGTFGIVTYDGNATALIKVENTTFFSTNVGTNNLVGNNLTQWFTDGCAADRPCGAAVVALTGEEVPTQPLDSIPEDADFLGLDDPWLLHTREVRLRLFLVSSWYVELVVLDIRKGSGMLVSVGTHSQLILSLNMQLRRFPVARMTWLSSNNICVHTVAFTLWPLHIIVLWPLQCF